MQYTLAVITSFYLFNFFKWYTLRIISMNSFYVKEIFIFMNIYFHENIDNGVELSS